MNNEVLEVLLRIEALLQERLPKSASEQYKDEMLNELKRQEMIDWLASMAGV